jgi:beta-lactamase class D
MQRFLVLLCILAISFTAMTSVNAAEIMIRDDLGTHFKGFTGTFVMYDPSNNKYIVYNERQSRKSLSPCSTFKIYNSLIGLETGVLNQEDANTVIKWNGIKHDIQNWNRDHTLATATQESVVWYFKKLATRIGEERMKNYIDEIGYGNRDISGGLTTFWLQSSLRISAMDQVALLNKLYLGNLPFSPANVEIVKKNITLSDNAGIRFMGKTGSGFQAGKWTLGWFVGFVEQQGSNYIFATNIEAPDGASGGKAKAITKTILKDLEIL